MAPRASLKEPNAILKLLQAMRVEIDDSRLVHGEDRRAPVFVSYRRVKALDAAIEAFGRAYKDDITPEGDTRGVRPRGRPRTKCGNGYHVVFIGRDMCRCGSVPFQDADRGIAEPREDATT